MGRQAGELEGKERGSDFHSLKVERAVGTGTGSGYELRISTREEPVKVLCPTELNLQYWPGIATLRRWFSDYAHREP